MGNLPSPSGFASARTGETVGMRIVAKTAWHVVFPPTQWTLGILGYRTCVQIEVALR